ncbi:hypothetical protein T10_1565 [Trichinella papuae]|uniref:Uncharacterized protein n=1 Tax=Trichinella papuae TaxID=268474 RepID=A0A0V1ML53_9BILA|nr:hypothetical protein T10_1565 [Trichinella papuae]
MIKQWYQWYRTPLPYIGTETKSVSYSVRKNNDGQNLSVHLCIKFSYYFYWRGCVDANGGLVRLKNAASYGVAYEVRQFKNVVFGGNQAQFNNRAS